MRAETLCLTGQSSQKRVRDVSSLHFSLVLARLSFVPRTEPFCLGAPLITDLAPFEALRDQPKDTPPVVYTPLEGGDPTRSQFYFYLLQTAQALDVFTGIPGLSARLLPLSVRDRDDAVPPEARGAVPHLGINGAYPPTFLLHGDRDSIVPVEESRNMARVLREKGVEVRYEEIEGVSLPFPALLLLFLTDVALPPCLIPRSPPIHRHHPFSFPSRRPPFIRRRARLRHGGSVGRESRRAGSGADEEEGRSAEGGDTMAARAGEVTEEPIIIASFSPIVSTVSGERRRSSTSARESKGDDEGLLSETTANGRQEAMCPIDCKDRLYAV